MICSHLCRITSAGALAAGARATNEPRSRPECQLSAKGLADIHRGKDASINDMLANGNGYPYETVSDYLGGFDMGCTEERRDMRSLLLWQNSLDQCLFDRKRGATA